MENWRTDRRQSWMSRCRYSSGTCRIPATGNPVLNLFSTPMTNPFVVGIRIVAETIDTADVGVHHRPAGNWRRPVVSAGSTGDRHNDVCIVRSKREDAFRANRYNPPSQSPVSEVRAARSDSIPLHSFERDSVCTGNALSGKTTRLKLTEAQLIRPGGE